MALLEVSNLSRSFRGVRALSDMSLSVEAGEIVGLIGPNGAGKSTFFSVVAGSNPPDSGEVRFDGVNVSGLKPHAMARKGLVRSFQANVLFGEETVRWNVSLGCHLPAGYGLLGAMFSIGASAERSGRPSRLTDEILEFVGITHLQNLQASTLSYGHQRILGLAIALAASPRLLLLDEPASGMDAGQLAAVLSLIRRIRQRGVTIVLIEHNMRTIFELCDRIIVMSAGTKLAEGAPDEIRRNESVIAAYLGGGAVA